MWSACKIFLSFYFWFSLQISFPESSHVVCWFQFLIPSYCLIRILPWFLKNSLFSSSALFKVENNLTETKHSIRQLIKSLLLLQRKGRGWGGDVLNTIPQCFLISNRKNWDILKWRKRGARKCWKVCILAISQYLRVYFT